jgi:hypothetical protein
MFFFLILFAAQSTWSMELPVKTDKVPSLVSCALKKVYECSRKGFYSKEEQARIAQLLTEEAVRQHVEWLAIDPTTVLKTTGSLHAYKNGVGVQEHSATFFWETSGYSLIDYPENRKRADITKIVSGILYSGALSADGAYFVGNSSFDDSQKIFVLDTKTGSPIFMSDYDRLAQVGFLTNRVVFVGALFYLGIIDLDQPNPQLQIIAPNSQADLFRSVASLQGKWLITNGIQAIYCYHKTGAFAQWQCAKVLRAPGLREIVPAQESPLFAQICIRKSQNQMATFRVSFYHAVEGAISYDSTGTVADSALIGGNSPATFFAQDRYFATAVLFNQWFNQSNIIIIDRFHACGPRVVCAISLPAFPKSLFAEGGMIYSAHAHSTSVHALNKWIASEGSNKQNLKKTTCRIT